MKLPQRCPNVACNADLTDPTLPADKEEYRDLFSLVQLVKNDGQRATFRCPVCGHVWVLGSAVKKAKRSGNPAKRGR